MRKLWHRLFGHRWDFNAETSLYLCKCGRVATFGELWAKAKFLRHGQQLRIDIQGTTDKSPYKWSPEDNG